MARIAQSEGHWNTQPAEPAALAYAWVFGTFLLLMLSLTFAEPVVHEAALALRWPVLAAFAAVGLLVACQGVFWHRAHLAIGAVVLLAAASSAYAPDAQYSLLRSVSLALLFTGTLGGLAAYCRSRPRVQLVTDVFWVLSIVAAIGGLVYRFRELGADGRFTGLHDRATGAGGFIALLLPLGLFQMRYRLGGPAKLFGGAITVLLTIELLLTGARVAIVVGGGVGLVLALVYFRGRAVVALLVLFLAASIPVLVDDRCREWGARRAEPLLRLESLQNFTGRRDRWRFGWEQFCRRPWLGHGFGVSRTIAGDVEPRRFHIEPGETFLLHSDQIEVLVDLGVVGYGPFAALWMLAGLAGWRILKDRPSPARSLAFAYLGSTAYVFADTFMHGGFLAAGGGVAPFSWSILAVLFTYPQWRTQSVGVPPSRRYRRPASARPFRP